MGRACPFCGKGMFRRKQLLNHIKHHHPSQWKQYYENKGSGGSIMTKQIQRKQYKQG